MPDNQPIPENAEGRQLLLDRIAAAKAAGDNEEAARILIKLAHLVKQIGPTTEKPWYHEYQEYVNEAHELLEGSGNKKLLAAAHRAVNLPFCVTPETAKEHLETALRLSKECGDDEGRGDALLALSKLGLAREDGSHIELADQAKEAFEKAGDLSGIALTKMTLGVQGRDLSKRERGDLLIESADLFEKADSLRNARRALMMALVFGADAMGEEEIHAIGARCVDLCRKSGAVSDEALCYLRLKQMFSERGNADSAAKYGALEDSLDVAVYGSRLGRLQADLETLKMNLECPESRAAKKRMKAEVIRVEAEIAGEQGKGLV